jgi:hypothetical protein
MIKPVVEVQVRAVAAMSGAVPAVCRNDRNWRGSLCRHSEVSKIRLFATAPQALEVVLRLLPD